MSTIQCGMHNKLTKEQLKMFFLKPGNVNQGDMMIFVFHLNDYRQQNVCLCRGNAGTGQFTAVLNKDLLTNTFSCKWHKLSLVRSYSPLLNHFKPRMMTAVKEREPASAKHDFSKRFITEVYHRLCSDGWIEFAFDVNI